MSKSTSGGGGGGGSSSSSSAGNYGNPVSTEGAARESTSSKALSGQSTNEVLANSASRPQSAGSPSEARTASTAMQANSMAGASVHDEVEDGEGEVEQPSDSPNPSTIPRGIEEEEFQRGGPSGGVDSAPASSCGGSSKLSPKTSGHRSKSRAVSSSGSSAGGSGASTAAGSTAASTAAGSKAASTGGASTGGASKLAAAADDSIVDGSSGADPSGKKKKKVTKFRYHKRITVRTHGKTSPSTIMDKVNKKNQSEALTPSTLGDIDPQELMQRAGIKGNDKARWRVRLRQTKRLTKDGKTVTQTKVAYRDSEGNKRVKTVPGTECKKCGKKIDDCKCDE